MAWLYAVYISTKYSCIVIGRKLNWMDLGGPQNWSWVVNSTQYSVTTGVGLAPWKTVTRDFRFVFDWKASFFSGRMSSIE